MTILLCLVSACWLRLCLCLGEQDSYLSSEGELTQGLRTHSDRTLRSVSQYQGNAQTPKWFSTGQNRPLTLDSSSGDQQYRANLKKYLAVKEEFSIQTLVQKDSEISSQKYEDTKKKTSSLPEPIIGLWKISISKTSPSVQAATLSPSVSSKYLPKGPRTSQSAPNKIRNGLVEKEIQKNLPPLSEDLGLNDYLHIRVPSYFQPSVFPRNHTIVEEETSGTSPISRAGNRHITSRNPIGDDVDNRTQLFLAIEVNDLPISNMTLDLFSSSRRRLLATDRRRAARSVTPASELDRVQPWRKQARTLPLEVQKRLRAVFDRTGDTPQFRSLVDRAVAQYGSPSVISVARGEEGLRPGLINQQQAAPTQEHRTGSSSQALDVHQQQQLLPQQSLLQHAQQQQPQQSQLVDQRQQRQQLMQDQLRQQQPRTHQIHQQQSQLAQQQQTQRLNKQQPQKQRNSQPQPLQQQDFLRYRLQQQLQEQRLSHQQRRAQQRKTFSDLGNVTLAAPLKNTSGDNVTPVGSNGHLHSTLASLPWSRANSRPIFLPTTDHSTREHHDPVEGQVQGQRREQNVLKQDALSPSARSSSHTAESSAPAMLVDSVIVAHEVTSLPSSVTQTTTKISKTMLLSSSADSLSYQKPQAHSQVVEEMHPLYPKAVNTVLAKDFLPNSNVVTGIQPNILRISGPLAANSTHRVQTPLSNIQILSEDSVKNLSAGIPSKQKIPDGNLTHVPLGRTEVEREILSRMPGHVAQNATLRRLFLDMVARAKQQAQEARRTKGVKEIPAVPGSPLQTKALTAGHLLPALTESTAAASVNSSVLLSSPQSPPVIILPANHIPSEGSIERFRALFREAISQQLPVWSEQSLQSAFIQALRESSSLTLKGQKSSLTLEGALDLIVPTNTPRAFTSTLDAVAMTTSMPVATTPPRTLLEPAITFILSLPETSLRNLQSSSIEALLQPMISATAGSGETPQSKIDQFKLALYDTLTSDPKSYVLVTNETRWQVRYKREDGGPTVLVEELMSGYLSGIVDLTKLSATLTPVLEFTWMFEAGTVPGTAKEAVEMVLARFGRKSTTSSTTSTKSSAVTSTTQNPMMPFAKITSSFVVSDMTSQTSTPSPLWAAFQTTPPQQRKVQAVWTTHIPVTRSTTIATLSSVTSPWSTTGRASNFMPSSPKVKASFSVSEKVNFHTTTLPASRIALFQQPRTQTTSRTTTSKLGITETSFSSSTQVPPSLTSIVNLDKPLVEKDTDADVKNNDDEVSPSPLDLTSVSAPFQIVRRFYPENVNLSGHDAASIKSDNSFSNLQEADEQTAQTNSNQQSPEYFDTTTTVPFSSIFQKDEDADDISQTSQGYTTVSWHEPFTTQHSSTSQLPLNSRVTYDWFTPDFSSSSLLSDQGNRMSELFHSTLSLPSEGRPLKITTHSSSSGDSQMFKSPSPEPQTFVTLETASAISSTISSTVMLDKHSAAVHSRKQSSIETRMHSSSHDTEKKYSESRATESNVSLLLGLISRSPILDSSTLSSRPVIPAPSTEIPHVRRLVDVTYHPPVDGFLDDGLDTLKSVSDVSGALPPSGTFTAVSDIHAAVPTSGTLTAVSNSLTSRRSDQPERNVQLLMTPQHMNHTEPTTPAINRHNSTFFGLNFGEFMEWIKTHMPNYINPAAPSMTSTKSAITTTTSTTTVPTTSTKASTMLPPVCPLNEAVKCGPRARRTNRLAALCELKCDTSTATCDLSLCHCFCVPTTGHLSLQLAPKRQLTTGTAATVTTSTPGPNTTTENPEHENESESD